MHFFGIAAWVMLALSAGIVLWFALKSASNIHALLSPDNQLEAKPSLDIARLFGWMGFIALLIWTYVGFHADEDSLAITLWVIGAVILVIAFVFVVVFLKDADNVYRAQLDADETDE